MQITLLVLVILLQGLLLFLLARGQTGRKEQDGPVLGRLDEQSRALDRVENSLRQDLATQRTELHEILQRSLVNLGEKVGGSLSAQKDQLDTFAGLLNGFSATSLQEAGRLRTEVQETLKNHGVQNGQIANALNDAVSRRLSEARSTQDERLGSFQQQLERLSGAIEQRLTELRQEVEKKLQTLQEDNTKQLDRMRQTVDEKLQTTLDQRLSESFKQVSERLEKVHHELGQIQALAGGVDDLRRVLSNIKTRGTWGEVQLGCLLEQMLSPDQYATNVKVNPAGEQRVEFAIKLPGREEGQAQVWLPLDSKFPMNYYQAVLEAQDKVDKPALLLAGTALERQVRLCAVEISTKYLCPPHTTDFGVMFLPTEGLYAEVTRRPELMESLRLEHRIVVAGPSTCAALLNALQMGFRTLAIQQRSSEVWRTLGQVKTEFGKFGSMLDRVGKKLDEAKNQLDDVQVRTRRINRSLKEVQEPAVSDHLLSPAEAIRLVEEEDLPEGPLAELPG